MTQGNQPDELSVLHDTPSESLQANDDPTETSLAMLASIFTTKSRATLLNALADADSDVQAASLSLLDREDKRRSLEHSGKKKQRKLDNWMKLSKRTSGSPVCEKQQQQQQDLKEPPSSSRASSHPLKTINQVLRDDATSPSRASLSSKATPKPPITLLTPDQIAASNLPCTLIPDILPRAVAGRLFLAMLKEAESWKRNKWFLATRDVVSPHTTSFYTDRPPEDANGDGDSYRKEASFWYNGRRMDGEGVKSFTSEMAEARDIIEPVVNEVLRSRKRFPLEWAGDWKANVAAANCYSGSKEASCGSI
jgi:hypothetical protein